MAVDLYPFHPVRRTADFLPLFKDWVPFQLLLVVRLSSATLPDVVLYPAGHLVCELNASSKHIFNYHS